MLHLFLGPSDVGFTSAIVSRWQHPEQHIRAVYTTGHNILLRQLVAALFWRTRWRGEAGLTELRRLIYARTRSQGSGWTSIDLFSVQSSGRRSSPSYCKMYRLLCIRGTMSERHDYRSRNGIRGQKHLASSPSYDSSWFLRYLRSTMITTLPVPSRWVEARLERKTWLTQPNAAINCERILQECTYGSPYRSVAGHVGSWITVPRDSPSRYGKLHPGRSCKSALSGLARGLHAGGCMEHSMARSSGPWPARQSLDHFPCCYCGYLSKTRAPWPRGAVPFSIQRFMMIPRLARRHRINHPSPARLGEIGKGVVAESDLLGSAGYIGKLIVVQVGSGG